MSEKQVKRRRKRVQNAWVWFNEASSIPADFWSRLSIYGYATLTTTGSTSNVVHWSAESHNSWNFDDDIAPWVDSFHSNARRLAEMHGSIEAAAVADALECDWPEIEA